jgi:DNA mismatch repair protein MutS
MRSVILQEELKEYETKILGAEEKIHKIESELFEQLVAWIATYIKPVQLNANLVAQLVVFFYSAGYRE